LASEQEGIDVNFVQKVTKMLRIMFNVVLCLLDILWVTLYVFFVTLYAFFVLVYMLVLDFVFLIIFFMEKLVLKHFK